MMEEHDRPHGWKRAAVTCLLLICVAAVSLIGYLTPSTRLDAAMEDYSAMVAGELPEDLRLTIHYLSPMILTRVPLSGEDLIHYSLAETIVVDSGELRAHQDLMRRMDASVLRIDRSKPLVNARLYYVFSTEENGKLLEVVISPGNRDSVVNGFHVDHHDILYDLIAPFLTDEARDLFGI